MSNVIAFLERMGRDASLRHATAGQMDAMLQQNPMDPAVREAILAKDQALLESLLGANTNVCCALAPADDEKTPQRDDDEEIFTASRSAVR